MTRRDVMGNLKNDMRQGWRLMSKNPGFTLIAVLTLALGIGANTAIFSVVDTILLKPLSYRRSNELVMLWSDLQKLGATRVPASGAVLKAVRDRGDSFQGVGAIWASTNTFTGEAEPEQVKVGRVTANFFSVLETQ